MDELLNTKWKATRVGTPALKGTELTDYQSKLGNEWQVVAEQKLEKEYKFPNFVKALDFTNKVGELAEELNHHPDIFLAWGKSKVQIWTHRIDGIAPMDFVYAARIEKIFQDNFST